MTVDLTSLASGEPLTLDADCLPGFARQLAFVDVETTGSSPAQGRLTEVAVVRVWRDDAALPSDDDDDTFATGDPESLEGAPLLPPRPGTGPWRIERWSTLLNPGMPIPPEIQFLTGIRNDMVAGAPRFEDIAQDLLERLRGAVFIAHHARFDYGFLKQSFARAGLAFGARTLCTVRLSKLLDPDRAPHSLDALIARHSLPVTQRHRAMGDALVLWDYLQAMYRRRGRDVVEPAIRLLLKQPSLPAHLPADTLRAIPRGPGVYLFHGLNAHPLYIGKSTQLRTRVASHFVADWRSERGLRLASETRRIEWHETAGDLGARLLEQTLIHERLPAHNLALRRRLNQVVVAPIDPAHPKGLLRFVKLSTLTPQDLPGHYGPFASRVAVRRLLEASAADHGLCLRRLGIERGAPGTPCFNRQLGRCAGACVGVQDDAALAAAVAEVLAPHRVPAWRWPGPVALIETDPVRGRSDWLVADQWCYLGRASDADAARTLAAAAPRRFDTDAYRLLKAALDVEVPVGLEPDGTAAQPPAGPGSPLTGEPPSG